ncbi:unnamed protein product [Zymoseptoria tritici ST99CH_3D7]|uniref:Uncharacterized protein n=1 Tax=Zymoseptoria tritici (strain ST99CH_3D7) TaxID=1276538 RepID=A0A1X7RPH4_ZYMT9|nr:unnamed protein product [Zymoseptoria tritici ST99CH_3D7]
MADTKHETGTVEMQPWDAKQCEEALAQIGKLQAQIDGLRTCIPSIVSPLTQRGADKTQRFAQLRAAAVGTSTDLQTFKQDWSSEQTQRWKCQCGVGVRMASREMCRHESTTTSAERHHYTLRVFVSGYPIPSLDTVHLTLGRWPLKAAHYHQ